MDTGGIISLVPLSPAFSAWREGWEAGHEAKLLNQRFGTCLQTTVMHEAATNINS